MKINLEVITALNPCTSGLKNFLEHYPNFDGTHEDFLSLEKISHGHKLWVMLRLMPRFEVEVFAIDCAVSAASYAANFAADAAYYAASAADAADAAYVASAATNAANFAAVHAASYAASAADAAYHTVDAAYAANAASYVANAAERERQLDVISYLIDENEKDEK